MLNFKCTNCENEIQAEYQYIGEMVQCPICDSYQIVPDPLLPNGSTFHGYQIRKILASTMLWNTYEAVGLTSLPDKQALLRVPSTFFMKNVSDFDSFVEMLLRTGSLKMPVFPELLDRCIAPSKVYFVYEFIPTVYKLSHFTKENQLDYSNVLMVASEIAASLSDAWEKDGLIHQNLNPLNIRITSKLKPWIMNMGQSQFLLLDQHLLQYGFNIWDYHYMSPEFISHGIADTPSCDIYALGGIIFLLCTGKEPHEDADPEDIANAPIPSISEFVPDIPDKLNSLIQLMMNPNPKLRLNTWDEVIERIDRIITDTAKLRKNDDILKEFNLRGLQTGRYEPVGLQPGHFRKKAIKASTGKIHADRSVSMSDTMAKLASRDEIKALNRQWRQKQQHKPHKKPKGGASNATVAVFAVVFVFVAIISFLVVYYANKAKREMPRPDLQNIQGPTRPDGTPRQPGRIQQSPAAAETHKTPPSIPPRTATTGDTAKSANESEFEDISKFLENNPEMRDVALERYAQLVSKTAKAHEFELADKIQIQISTLNEDLADADSEKVKLLLDVIRNRIRPLLQEGKYDEALDIVTNYDGELSAESRRQRLRLALAIQNRVTDIDKGQDEKAEVMQAFVQKFARTLMQENKILETKIKIDLALQLEKDEVVKKQAEIWLEDIGNLERIETGLAAARTADDLIGSPENKEIFADSPLLRGLAYFRKSQFEKARESFDELPAGAGKVFVSLMKEKEAEATFKTLLEKSGFKFDTEKPDGLLRQLTEKTLRKTEAEALSKDMAGFSKSFEESKFLKDNANLINALNIYCTRIAGVATHGKTEGVTVKPDESVENSGITLQAALEDTKSGDKITLEQGSYKLGDIHMRQADIKLKGVGKVFIDASNVIVSGRSITFENISFINGTVRVDKANAVSFINCRLKGRETQVVESGSIRFDNCLIKGVYIKNTTEIVLQHCTIITPVGGIEAALRLEGESLEITDSILYGEKYAMMVMLEEDAARRRTVSNTLWFGEAALLVKQVGNQPVAEKDIISRPTKLRRFTRTKSNIHRPPVFMDALNGDYRLVKGVPGSGASSDKRDCGVIWPTEP